MKDKQVHFNIGFFRSGQTLLRSILNQNPNFYMTPNSITAEILYRISEIRYHQMFYELSDYEALERIIKQVWNFYYEPIKAKYLLEQGPWGTPDNYQILRESRLSPPGKFICLIRPLKEIIASWVKFDKPENIEIYVEELMGEYGRIGNTILCIDHLNAKDQKDLKLIHYYDLCEKPKETIKAIYKHLNIPHFEHRFTDLDQPGTVAELSKFPDLIKIRKDKLNRVEYDYDKFCPPKILERYGHINEAIKRYCVKARSRLTD